MQEKLSSYVMYLSLGIGTIAFIMGLVIEYYNFMIYYSYALLGLAVVGIFTSFIFSIKYNPSSIKPILMGVGGMILLIVICYFIAEGNLSAKQISDGVSETASKWSGTLLYVLYMIFGLTIISITYSFIILIKRK